MENSDPTDVDGFTRRQLDVAYEHTDVFVNSSNKAIGLLDGNVFDEIRDTIRSVLTCDELKRAKRVLRTIISRAEADERIAEGHPATSFGVLDGLQRRRLAATQLLKFISADDH